MIRWANRQAVLRHGIEPFEFGRSSISPVSPDDKSKVSFPFTGTVDKITFEASRRSGEPPRSCRYPMDPPRPARLGARLGWAPQRW